MVYSKEKKSLELVSKKILMEEWNYELYFIARISSTSNRRCLQFTVRTFSFHQNPEIGSLSCGKKALKPNQQKSWRKNEIFNYYFYPGHVAHNIESIGKHSVYSNFSPKIGGL